MKKYISAVLAAAMLCGLCSCGEKVKSESAGQTPTEASTETSEETTEAATEASEAAESSASAEAATTAPAATTAVSPDSAPEGADLSVFHSNTDGAVVFDAPAGDQSDATLIAAAQLLYNSAHDTSLRFSVGYPYDVDTNTTVKGSFDWDFCLVTEEGINSVADVKADYHRVFSTKYPDHIEETYMDSNGRVYALCGGRGSDILYVKSEVISYDGKTDDELFFTVRSYYDGSDWGDGAYTVDHSFSAVIDADGTWRAGVFTLPN